MKLTLLYYQKLTLEEMKNLTSTIITQVIGKVIKEIHSKMFLSEMILPFKWTFYYGKYKCIKKA